MSLSASVCESYLDPVNKLEAEAERRLSLEEKNVVAVKWTHQCLNFHYLLSMRCAV